MLDKLHTNQRLLVSELLKRKAAVTIVDIEDELLEVEFNGRRDFLLDRFSSVVPYHMVKCSADKHLAKNILNNNSINTPQGHIFTGNNIEQALDYAKDKYPVVLKPNWGSHGDFVQANIENSKDLEIAIWYFVAKRGQDEPFIIEKFIYIKEYRIFITALGGFAVVEREPASVTGNSKDSISQLAKNESNRRAIIKSKQYSCLCPIVLDLEVDNFLEKQNLNINSIINGKFICTINLIQQKEGFLLTELQILIQA